MNDPKNIEADLKFGYIPQENQPPLKLKQRSKISANV